MIEIYKGRTSRTEVDSDEFSNGNTTFYRFEQVFFNVFFNGKLSYCADSLWQKIATDFINNPSGIRQVPLVMHGRKNRFVCQR